jgi:hypothetical protein
MPRRAEKRIKRRGSIFFFEVQFKWKVQWCARCFNLNHFVELQF